jgi:steroid delta-isomerase-like uncharacterized protein
MNMTEANKNLIRFQFEEMSNKKNLDVIEQIYTADCMFRAPTLPEARGCEGRRQLAMGIFAAFPDICYTVQDLIAEGDKVVARWSAAGTHKGEWMGIKPEGKAISGSGISIFRISEGKIAEELAEYDSLGLVQRLSPPPAPPKSKPKPKAKPKKKAKVSRKKAAPKAKKRTRRSK